MTSQYILKFRPRIGTQAANGTNPQPGNPGTLKFLVTERVRFDRVSLFLQLHSTIKERNMVAKKSSKRSSGARKGSSTAKKSAKKSGASRGGASRGGSKKGGSKKSAAKKGAKKAASKKSTSARGGAAKKGTKKAGASRKGGGAAKKKSGAKKRAPKITTSKVAKEVKRVAGNVLVGAATGAVVGALKAVVPEAQQATDKLDETKETMEQEEPGEQ
jgi:hypothetical protein